MNLNNKKTLFLLVPAVLVIWGLVAYRLVDALGEPDFEIPNSGQKVITQERDTDTNLYVLNLEYPDPFRPDKSSSSEKAKPASKSPQETKSTKITFKPIALHWPRVQYRGLIVKKGQSLCLVEIDGQIYFMSLGDRERGLELIDAKSDSIQFKFHREKKYFKK